MFTRLVFLLLLGGLAVRPASATPIFTFTFNPATYTSSVPDFTVDLITTITNIGTTAIDSVDIVGITYINTNVISSGFGAPPNITSGNPLNPGQSITFDFFNLTYSGVPTGTYFNSTFVPEADITLDDATGANASVRSSNLPTLVVTPEPSAFLLMATGAVGLLARVRRRA